MNIAATVVGGNAACLVMAAVMVSAVPAAGVQPTAVSMKYRDGTYYFISKDPSCTNAGAGDPDNYCGTVEVVQIKGSRVRRACYGPQWPNCMGTNGWARLVKGRIIGTSDNGVYQWRINEPVFPPKTGDQAMIRVSHKRASAEYPELDENLYWGAYSKLPFRS